MADDLKLARLVETFEDIDTSFVESLIQNNPDASLQFLINQCRKHQNTNNDDNDNHNDKKEGTFIISSEPVSIGCDISHIETLDNIQPLFHYLFDPYLLSPYLFKLIDIFNHLTIMREEYKYNNQDIHQLNLCIKTVYNFMNNIYSHPDKEKYRRIRESNKIFQRKIGQVKGSKLLLTLCGWIYIEMDQHNNNNGSYSSIYLFESSINIDFIHTVVQFLNEYMKHPKISILPSNKTSINKQQNITNIPCKQEIENNISTITEAKTNENEIKINKPLSKQDKIRQHRLKNFGDIKSLTTKVSKSKCNVGPKLGSDYKTKRQSNDKKLDNYNANDPKFRRSKHFNIQDIIRLRKIDFDRKAAGPKVKSALDSIGFKCLQLTNKFRCENGLTPLKWHQTLCEIGKVHSKNMGDKVVPIGHDGFHDRVEKIPFYSLRSAENVAMNMDTTIGVAQTAVNGWIKSPGHRKNLLGAFTHCAIGVYQNFEGAMYLTQLFAFNHLWADGLEVDDLDETT